MLGGIDLCLCVVGLHLNLEGVEREIDRKVNYRLCIYYFFNGNNAAYAALMFSSK